MPRVGSAVTARPFTFIIDTDQRITPAGLVAMRDDIWTPARAILVYIPLLTADYVADIHGANLAIIPVTYGNRPGFIPSASDGQTKGTADVLKLQSVACPATVTVISDFEETAPGATAQQAQAELNARGVIQKQAGFDPGVYVGAEQPMNGAQLDAVMQDRYMKGLSRLTSPGIPQGFVIEPLAGWCIEQLSRTTVLAGINVDVSVIHYDWRGRLPTWWAP